MEFEAKDAIVVLKSDENNILGRVDYLIDEYKNAEIADWQNKSSRGNNVIDRADTRAPIADWANWAVGALNISGLWNYVPEWLRGPYRILFNMPW